MSKKRRGKKMSEGRNPKLEEQIRQAWESIAGQTFRVSPYYPGAMTFVAETLVQKIMAVQRREGREPDLREAMQYPFQLSVPLVELTVNQAMQAEIRFDPPELHAVFYLGLDGNIWASDVLFFPFPG